MIRKLLEKFNLIKPRQSQLTKVKPDYTEKSYVHSYTDAVSFVSNLRHNTEYEILDLVENKWVKQRYTFLVDNNEQEETRKMIHGFRMGWCRLCNNQ